MRGSVIEEVGAGRRTKGIVVKRGGIVVGI